MNIRVMIAAALVLSAQTALADAPKHCGLMLGTSLDIAFDPAGGPDIPVSIDGKTRQMLVDTGGVYSLLKESTVDELGLSKATVKGFMFKMLNGETLGYTAKAQNFDIGKIHYEAYNFSVISNTQIPGDTAGSVAPDILAHFDAEFDFAGKKLNLFSQDHCPGTVVYWADDYAKLPFERDKAAHITTDGVLDGQKVSIGVDTGSTFSSMNADRARAFGWDGKQESLVKTPVPGSDKFLYFYPFKSLELHGIAIAHPKIMAREAKMREGEDLILGMNVLRQLRIYIAYGEKTMYATGANATRAMPPATPAKQ